MKCKNCGTENESGSVFCANCGTSLQESFDDIASVEAEAVVSEPGDFPTENVKMPGKPFGIIGFVLGILGLVSVISVCSCFCCSIYAFLFSGLTCLIYGIAGLILSKIGKKKAASVGLSNKLANLGAIFSLIATIAGGVFVGGFVLYWIAYLILVVILGVGEGLFAIGAASNNYYY